jgi:hypothetical protein
MSSHLGVLNIILGIYFLQYRQVVPMEVQESWKSASHST